MNGEQLCYIHGFVHRSLLYSIDCSFRLYRLLPVVPFTAHHFYFSSSTFVFKRFFVKFGGTSSIVNK